VEFFSVVVDEHCGIARLGEERVEARAEFSLDLIGSKGCFDTVKANLVDLSIIELKGIDDDLVLVGQVNTGHQPIVRVKGNGNAEVKIAFEWMIGVGVHDCPMRLAPISNAARICSGQQPSPA